MTRKKKSGARISGKWALITIGALFAASAAMRFGATGGAAIAREVTNLTRAMSETDAPAQCETPPDIAEILSALQLREADLASKESELLTLQQSLSVARSEIEQQLAALQLAEQELSAAIATSSEAAENDLARLTNVYENMKPKDAADLFETMNPEFAAGFIGRMRADAAAAVMTGLTPEMAYAISVILAGRNAEVPTE